MDQETQDLLNELISTLDLARQAAAEVLANTPTQDPDTFHLVDMAAALSRESTIFLQTALQRITGG